MSPILTVFLALAEAVILLLVLLLGGCIGVRIRYNKHFVISLRILFLSVPIYKNHDKKELKKIKSPEKILKEQEKKRKRKEKAKLKKARAAEKKKMRPQTNPDAVTLNALDKVQLALSVVKTSLNDVKGNIEIKFKKMHVSVGTGNAASTAILYGLILEGVTAICETVEKKITHVQRKPGAMTVEADYEAKSTSADIDVVCSLRTVKGIRIALRILSEFKSQKAEMLAQKKKKKSKKQSRSQDSKSPRV